MNALFLSLTMPPMSRKIGATVVAPSDFQSETPKTPVCKGACALFPSPARAHAPRVQVRTRSDAHTKTYPCDFYF